MIGFVFEWLQNIVGEGENAGFQDFLLFLQCFQRVSSAGSLNLVKMWSSVNVRLIYFTSIEKQVLQHILIPVESSSWELQQYSRQICGRMKIPKLTPTPGNQTRDPKIVRLTLYLTTTDMLV